MQIEISANGFKATEAIREHVRTQVDHAIGHLGDRLTRVEVHLGDTNAKKGGPDDKRCMIEARPRGAQPVAIEHRSDDLYDAITEGASKIRRALTRKFERSDA
mgnify:CR=1 FL=1|jgi:ribosomal subunit interface protein